MSDHPVPHVPGRYELEQELARGGMGVVYRARDLSTGRTVALKRSLAEQGRAALIRSMLEREYQTLVTLRHPNIIQVYEFGVDAHGPYYTMELLQGSDLRSKCPLPWRDVCAYMRDIASSLALLHSRRLLHCDVSAANIYLTGEGRAKLLDFGTLASFGRNAIIAGSPAIMAPEVLAREELDQRVDLYALGATAYYALCGRHAFAANSIALLPEAWRKGRPPSPSTYDPSIPRELDELVLALLDHDRASRPSSAAELIDRLGAIAGLVPDQDPRVQRSYLYSTELVGRDAERKALAEHLKRASAGRGGGALIEGAPGLGKSFLLEDIAQKARVAGAHVIVVRARAQRGPLGVWSALLHEVRLAQAPSARSAASESQSHEPILRFAERKPLVLAIDDLHEADPDSLLRYADLAKAARGRKLLLLGTLDPSDENTRSPALRLVRERLEAFELRPLDAQATQAFVVGLFGDVAAAPRLSTYLANHGSGNPRVYSEVLEHLIAQGFIRYAEGTWILPDELPSVGQGGLDLAQLLDQAFQNRFARWGAALRTLAFCLSPHRRVFDLALCRELTEGEVDLRGQDLPRLLVALVREGVLVEDQGSYAFASARTRELLYRQLDEAHRKRLHRRLAEFLARRAGDDPKSGFEVGFHFLLAGEDKLARAHINRNVEASLAHPDMLVESVPDLWALLEQQRAAGARDEDVQFIEGMLVLSGYYLDPTVHDRYAKRVLLQLHRTLGFTLAARLSPWLGRNLALMIGVLFAWLRSLVRPPLLVGGGSFLTSLMIFVGACASWSAGACIRLERRVHAQLVEMLDVVRGLGRLNGLRLLRDLIEVGGFVVQGRLVDAQAGLTDQLDRLARVRFFTEEARQHYEAGLHFFIGRNQLLRLDSTTLNSAERIDALGATHDRLLSCILRRTYHLYRGDAEAAKREESRFDEMAARFGSRWVADVLSVLEFVPYHLSADVLGLKRTLHRVERLVDMAPNLAIYRDVVRAMYEGHRGRPERALAIYAAIDDQLAPFAAPIWATARGHQAECLNMLGRPAEALAVCEAARAHLRPEDRAYVFAYQQLEREAAVALAALGREGEAMWLMDELIAACAPYDNLLVKGLLHFDRARVACAMRDPQAFAAHAAAATAAFTKSGNPALIARAKRLRDYGRRAGLTVTQARPREDQAEPRLPSYARTRAERALEEVVQTVGCRSACLLLIMDGRVVLGAQSGDVALTSLLEDEIDQLARSLDGAREESVITEALARMPSAVLGTWRLMPLLARHDGTLRQLVGILLLGECERPGAMVQLDLGQLASELREDDDPTQVL